MNTKFNGTIRETNGVRTIAGGGTGETDAEAARANLGAIGSSITGITGATQLTNMMQITQAGYSAITSPITNTLYIIVG
jgi:phage-related tail fiber protein